MLRLLVQRLRRDRWTTPIWAVATALLALASSNAVATTYDSESARAELVRVITRTPALLALRGVPDGGGAGAFSYMQIYTYLALMAGLMSTFLVVRHTRQDEERGRYRLLGATAVSRTAPLVATLLDAVAANVLVTVLVGLGFAAGGLALGPSLLAGVATGGAGLACAGLAAIAAQVAPTSRSANGLSAGAVGVLWMLRAIGDALGTALDGGLSLASAWPSWITPIGWGQQVLPFTRADAGPLLLQLGLAAVAAGVALAVQSRRDLGASLVPERSGRATGRVRTPLGLAWRLHRGSVLGWALGGAAMGAIAGALADLLTSAVDDQPEIRDVIDSMVSRGQGSMEQEFLVVLVGLSGALAAAAGAHALIRARSDESDGRVELLLSSPVGRIRWMLSWLAIAVVAVAAVLATTALAGALALIAAGYGSDAPGVVAASAAQLPSDLACVGGAALLFALVPRVSIGVTWGLLGLALLIGLFGGLLNLPDAVRDASPFSHVPAVPLAGIDWAGAWATGIAAVVLAGVSVAVMRVRALTA